MIRFTPDGRAEVWFQLAGDSTRKVVFRLDEYLAFVRVAETETNLRAELFRKGRITDVTPEDRDEINFFRSQWAQVVDPLTVREMKGAAKKRAAAR